MSVTSARMLMINKHLQTGGNSNKKCTVFYFDIKKILKKAY